MRKATTRIILSNLVPCKRRKKIESKKQKAAAAYLPNDLIISTILARLPLKSLSRFNCVCKLWCATVDGRDPKFLAQHQAHLKTNPPLILGLFHVHDKRILSKSSYYNFISLDQEKLSSYLCFRNAIQDTNSHIVGYCNGLFCIRSMSGFEITNITTREVLLLPPPPPPRARRDPWKNVRYGFGYDPLSNQYHVIHLPENGNVFIFTLGAKTFSWTEVPISMFVFFRFRNYFHRQDTTYSTDSYNGLYSTGCLHWLLTYPQVSVLSFNLHIQQFIIVPAPSKFPPHTERYFFTVFKDRPCCGYQEEIWKDDVAYHIHLFWLLNDPFTADPDSRFVPKWVEQTIPIPQFFHPNTTRLGLTSYFDQFVFYYYDERKILMFYHPHVKGRTFVAFPPTFVGFPPGMRSDLLPDPIFIYHTENLISLKTFLLYGASADQIGYVDQDSTTRH